MKSGMVPGSLKNDDLCSNQKKTWLNELGNHIDQRYEASKERAKEVKLKKKERKQKEKDNESDEP